MTSNRLSVPNSRPLKDPTNPPILIELICNICTRVFNRPKQLSACGHVFCQACIEKIAKPAPVVKPGTKPMSIECPSCQMVSHVSGLQTLRTNLPLYNISEAVRDYERWYQESRSAAPSVSSPSYPPPSANCCSDFLINVPRSICSHCNAEFCCLCLKQHLEEVKGDVMELGKKLIMKLNSLSEQVDKISANSESFKAIFRRSIEGFSTQVAESVSASFSPVSHSLKTEAASLINQVASSSQKLSDQLFQAVEKWKDDDELKQHFAHLASIASGEVGKDDYVTKTLTSLLDLEHEIDFVLNFASEFPQWEFSLDENLPLKFESLSQNLSLGTFSFKMAPLSQLPPESQEEEMEFDGDRAHTPPLESPMDVPENQPETQFPPPPPPHESIPTPAPTPFIPSFTNLEPYGKSFYDNIAVFSSFLGEDILGNEIRKPTASCLVMSENHEPTVAVVHNSRRISLFSPSKLETTFEIDHFPGVYLGWDIACDAAGGLFITSHRRTEILSFRISQENFVVPSIFSETNDRFHGLAVCNERKEIFSAQSSGIAAIGLEDKAIHFVIPFPVILVECCVCSVLREDDLFRVVFSYENGRKMHSFKLPQGDLSDEHLSQIGERYSNIAAMGDGDKPFQALAIDPVGSVVLFNGTSRQLQVFTQTGNLMSSLPLEGNFEPTSLTILPPYPDVRQSPALAVVNSSANNITFYALS